MRPQIYSTLNSSKFISCMMEIANKKLFSLLILVLLTVNISNGQIALRGTATSGTTSNTSITINKPTGVVAGDVMIVNIAQNGNNTTNPSLSGWTLIQGSALAGSSRYQAVLYKVAGASEGSSYTFTLGSGVTSAAGSIVAFSNVDVSGTDPFDVTPGTITASTSGSTSVSATSLTTVSNNAAIIMFGAAVSSAPTWSGWSTTSPATLTELYDNQSASASVGAAWALKSTAGSTGAGSATLSASERNGGILIALAPIKTATTTTIASSINPTTYGTAPTFTATVSPSAVSGTVEFFNGATSLGIVTLTGTTTKTATLTPTATQLSAGTLSIKAVYSGNAVYASSTSANLSQTVNQRAITLTGSKVYDGTNAAAAATLTVSNNIDGANLTLAGSAVASSQNVGTRTLAIPVSPARIQFASGSTGANAASSFTVTLPSAPQNGNTLIAVVSTRNNAANTVSSITQTGVTGWTRATQAINANGSTTEIWYAPSSTISGASVTVNLAQSNVRTAATVIEYKGVYSVDPLDVVNNNFGTGTAASTGSITTTQNNSLLIGGVSYTNSANTLGSISGGFTTVTTTSTTNGTTTNNTELYVLENIVTSTSTYTTGGTISASSNWTAAIVALNAELPNGTALTLGGSAAANYTTTGLSGTYTISSPTLTITAKNITKCFGTTYTFSSADYTITGLVAGETVGSVTLTSSGAASTAAAGTYSIVPSAATGGTFTASNYTINYVNGTMTVGAIPVAPTAGNNSRCGTGTVALSATPGAGETIDWYAAATGGTALLTGSNTYTTPSLTTTTTYYAEARNTTAGCLSTTRTAVTATVNAIPTASISGTTTACGSVSLTASGGATYLWSGGTTTTSASNTFTTSGTYTVTVTSASGCTSTSSATVTVNSVPSGLTASTNSSAICTGSSANLSATATGLTSGTIAFQGFETSGSTVNYTSTGGATKNGTSGFSDAPSFVSFASTGSNSYWINNGTATITTGNITGLASYSSKKISVDLASFSIGSTSNGADGTDVVTIAVSLDGGTTYSNELSVNGGTSGNSYWSFTSGTGIATVTYDGNNSATIFAPTGGGARTTDGYSTLEVNLPENCSQAIIKITMLNNSTNEAWLVDNITLTGIPTTFAWTSNPSGFTSSSQNVTVSPTVSTVYTVTATGSNGCTASDTVGVTVAQPNAATISYSGTPFCKTVTSALVTRTGTTGGTYSSTAGLSINASTGEINPSLSTAGTYTVTYSMAANGCTAATATTSVTINAEATGTINYTGTPFCKSLTTAQSVTLTGTTGGTYSASPAGLSINASTGAITPSTSTAGTYTITYTVTPGGCTTYTTTTTATITTLPAATISYAGTPFCKSVATAQPVTVTGTMGGTFSSTAGLTINASTGEITP
ncbi:MAG: beta strand repeat-containing protein, partial [Bacteroidota bacterium]